MIIFKEKAYGAKKNALNLLFVKYVCFGVSLKLN